jgi:hypothetical protein
MRIVTNPKAGLSEGFIQKILTQFNDIGVVVQDGRNTVKYIEVEGKTYNFKRFKQPNWINRWVYLLFRSSKAQRSFEYAQILSEKKVGTAMPVAYIEHMGFLGFGISYYVSEHVIADYTFRDLIHEPIEERDDILKAFAAFIFHMHEQGVYFLDNSPGNTLIKKSGSTWDFYLVDLNRMKFYDIPWEERLKNFERLSPKRDMYEVMGAAYCDLWNEVHSLSRKRTPQETIDKMWGFTCEFQKKFHRKKALKRKLKGLFKG